MDFVLINGSTPDEVNENMFKWSVNMSAKVERLRDFVGLEANNMMRIVSAAADIMKSKYVNANKKANVELVHNWLVTNIRWGAFHCPDIQTVTRHMDNWQAIKKDDGALAVVEAAVQQYGRHNLLDWQTKLGIIVSKTDASSLRYVVEALAAHMWRKNDPDPYGTTELKRVIGEIMWSRSYIKTVYRQYPELSKSQTNPAENQGLCSALLVKHYLDSPRIFLSRRRALSATRRGCRRSRPRLCVVS